MENQRLGNYLRTHRKRAGLSQHTLATVLGLSEHQLSRYERMQTLPPLVTALAFEFIFGISVSELFAGLHDTVQCDVEGRLHKLETALQDTSAKCPSAAATARALEWMEERRANRV